MFNQQNRRSRQHLASGGARLTYEEMPYPTRLNFYKDPPPLEISIEEFEQFALDRMQSNAERTRSPSLFLDSWFL